MFKLKDIGNKKNSAISALLGKSDKNKDDDDDSDSDEDEEDNIFGATSKGPINTKDI
jgi:hypothetical protein